MKCFLSKIVGAVLYLSTVLRLEARSLNGLQEVFENNVYNLTSISSYNLQFCAIVEIGRGYCSLFLEMRSEPSKRDLESTGVVAEMYLGSCHCNQLRQMKFCSDKLEAERPDDCSLGDPNGADSNYTRVHRRLCDLRLISKHPPCSCREIFDKNRFRRVRGFPTCYQWPIENWLCERHSVCGVAKCVATTLSTGPVLVQCDHNCIDKQPFCEPKPTDGASSTPRVVTSVWSDWTCPSVTSANLHEDDTSDVVQVCQSKCVDSKSRKPAFDCLGPGANCCSSNMEECNCKVVTTPSNLKLVRYVFLKKNFDPDIVDNFIYS